jgi:hypothetical protein
MDTAYRSGDNNCLARLAEAGVRSVDGFVLFVVPCGCRGREWRLHLEFSEIGK